MKLITAEIQRALDKTPIMTHDESKPEDVPVIVKFFYPMGRYTFYVTECETDQDGNMRFFGFCISPIDKNFDELGYLDFNELQSVRGMERDLHYKGTLLDAFKSAGFTNY